MFSSLSDNNKTMLLDIQTLLVAVALTTAFCAGARLLLWRMNLAIPGLGRWALAGGSTVISFLLILSYGRLHWPPALSLAQIFIIMSLIVSWDGFRRFLGKPPLTPLILIGIAALGLFWIAIAHAQYSVGTKAAGNAVFVSILSVLIARDLFKSSRKNTPAVRVTGYVYAANAAIFLIRAFFAQEYPDIVEPVNPNGVAAFMLLWLLCSIIAITLGMILMAAERLQIDLKIQANHDPLTGALNRRACSLLCEKSMAHARRHTLPLSILMMDLDEFKKVNDQLGHDLGDKVLCRFVSVAHEMQREEDIFCRFGGEEFLALLPNTSAQAALSAANRLRNAFEINSALIETKKSHQPFALTVSIGIAELQADEDFESLLRRADTALYLAKDNGRNRCEIAG
ncbi:MAG TPA: GGDEF domain-containing protein [Thiopseudomonas sp.]|nr:GGDEF domain-containing protein [Thiopseudomonas sp.]